MRRSPWILLLGMATGLAIGLYLGLSDTRTTGGGRVDDPVTFAHAQPNLLQIAIFLGLAAVALAVGTLLIIYVHEMGHLLAGVALGFEPIYVLVGPLMIDLGGAGIRLGLNPWRRQYGGAVIFSTPSRSDRQLARQWAVMAVAGPAANVAFGAALLWLARSGLMSEEFAGWVAAIGALSVALGLINLLPVTRFGLIDGAYVRILLRGGERADRLLGFIRTSRTILSPVRPADWGEEAAAAAETAMTEWPLDRPRDLLDYPLGAAELLFYRYADRGEFDRLSRLLEAVAATPRTPRQLRFGLLAGHDVHLALYLAAWGGEPGRARAILEGVPDRAPIRANSIWHTAWAAVYAAEGNSRRAGESAGRALAILRRFGVRSGADQAERAWVESFAVVPGRPTSAQRTEAKPTAIGAPRSVVEPVP